MHLQHPQLGTTATLRDIPPGPRGTYETLKEMARMVRAAKERPAMHQASAQIIAAAQLPAKDWIGQIRAIHRYVQTDFQYLRDPVGIETVRTPEVTMGLGMGDCDDLVTLTCTLLEVAGHPCRFAALRFGDNLDFSHVVAETRVGPRWIGLEVTEPWPMGRVPPYTEKMVVRI